jgi:hypothetical protein
MTQRLDGQMGRLLADAKVCERFSKSQRTIDRWTADPKLGFPHPIYIRGRKHRDADALAAFEKKLIASAKAVAAANSRGDVSPNKNARG